MLGEGEFPVKVSLRKRKTAVPKPLTTPSSYRRDCRAKEVHFATQSTRGGIKFLVVDRRERAVEPGR